MSKYEPIEPQFDLAAQEAKAVASRKPQLERSWEPHVEKIGATGTEAAFNFLAVTSSWIEAEKAALEPVPEVPGKVEQEPEIRMPDSLPQDQERP